MTSKKKLNALALCKELIMEEKKTVPQQFTYKSEVADQIEQPLEIPIVSQPTKPAEECKFEDDDMPVFKPKRRDASTNVSTSS